MQEVIATLRRLEAGDKVDYYELEQLKAQLNKWAQLLFVGALFSVVFSRLLALGAWGCLTLVLVLKHRYTA